ncbi:MAG: 50S ribosomal protein L4, partial [Candidatus Acidiferrales bacterium]
FRETLLKLDKETRTILLVETGENVNLERASRNIEGVTLVPATALVTYDLMRHDRLMLSREAALRLSRALSATKSEEAATEEAAAPAPAKKEASAAKAAPAKAAKKAAAPKAEKKPAVAKKPKKE